jgi:23S rRNA pseudouridine955/2504/2580 synthase
LRAPREKNGAGDRFSLQELEKLRRCIIHDDSDIVAFNKPAGLAVQGGTCIKKSLDKMAAALFPYETVLLVHRLDRETSGVIVCAKNQKAAQALAAEFQDKSAAKEYLALCAGAPEKKFGLIDNFVMNGHVLDKEEAEAFEKATGQKPRRAITKYAVLRELAGALSLIQFLPQTGRTHQLRLHAAFALGCPIVGDALYGGLPTNGKDKLLAMIDGKNLFLFAQKLSFRHPGTGKIITLRAEMPDFMKPVADFLGWGSNT